MTHVAKNNENLASIQDSGDIIRDYAYDFDRNGSVIPRDVDDQLNDISCQLAEIAEELLLLMEAKEEIFIVTSEDGGQIMRGPITEIIDFLDEKSFRELRYLYVKSDDDSLVERKVAIDWLYNI